MDKNVAHPDYYLHPGELRRAFADFEIMHATETAVKGNRSNRMKAVAQLVARKK